VTQRYEVRLARRAVRSLAHLQRQEQLRIRAAIDLSAENPRPPNCVALQGEPGVFRVRVGDFRILYELMDRLLLVQVLRVGKPGGLLLRGSQLWLILLFVSGDQDVLAGLLARCLCSAAATSLAVRGVAAAPQRWMPLRCSCGATPLTKLTTTRRDSRSFSITSSLTGFSLTKPIPPQPPPWSGPALLGEAYSSQNH